MDIERIEHLLERIDATPDLTEMDLRYRKMLLRKVARNRRVLADAVELRESRNPAPQAESA